MGFPGIRIKMMCIAAALAGCSFFAVRPPPPVTESTESVECQSRAIPTLDAVVAGLAGLAVAASAVATLDGAVTGNWAGSDAPGPGSIGVMGLVVFTPPLIAYAWSAIVGNSRISRCEEVQQQLRQPSASAAQP